MNIVLGTHNAGKVREFSELLASLELSIRPLMDFHRDAVEETGLTFIENALLKARYASKISGLPAIADDSGLVIHALNGAPGIYSARYAGQHADFSHHIQKVLTEMQAVADDQRQAYFHCVLVYLSHENDPTPLVCSASWHGTITHQPYGMGGFGYDPIFYVPSHHKTAAELSSQEKNQLSHRAQALQQLLTQLPGKL